MQSTRIVIKSCSGRYVFNGITPVSPFASFENEFNVTTVGSAEPSELVTAIVAIKTSELTEKSTMALMEYVLYGNTWSAWYV